MDPNSTEGLLSHIAATQTPLNTQMGRILPSLP
jgi:hypothetical protein